MEAIIKGRIDFLLVMYDQIFSASAIRNVSRQLRGI